MISTSPKRIPGISRREFLKALSVCAAGAALPVRSLWALEDWQPLNFYALPAKIQEILASVPRLRLGSDGILAQEGRLGEPAQPLPMARTLWNQERCKRADRLDRKLSWGIVLHWYGDRENFDRSVRGYLRGFDSLREVDDYMTRTSAHFLVGDAPVPAGPGLNQSDISILQTQTPDQDGIPFLASHLMPLDHLAHRNQQQYFVRALYTLSNQGSGPYTILQDFFDGPQSDPNYRTIAIEICGFDFEHAANAPSLQKIANVVGLVWSVMKRYRIFATDIFGHNEIQLGKADPGKKFTALIRFLIGAKALVEQDWSMLPLVFGPLMGKGFNISQAAERYLKFVRDYLVLSGSKPDVYEWEAGSKFWLVWDLVGSDKLKLARFESLLSPAVAASLRVERGFLQPENHSGVDLYRSLGRVHRPNSLPITAQLPADGICLFSGMGDECQPGGTAIFRHLQNDGAQILTVFGSLSQPGEIQVGQRYPQGYRVGRIEAPASYLEPIMHYAVAYGATWEADLQHNAHIPLNAGTHWIRERFLDPMKFYNHSLPGTE